jgi:hypothetical protein
MNQIDIRVKQAAVIILQPKRVKKKMFIVASMEKNWYLSNRTNYFLGNSQKVPVGKKKKKEKKAPPLIHSRFNRLMTMSKIKEEKQAQ